MKYAWCPWLCAVMVLMGGTVMAAPAAEAGTHAAEAAPAAEKGQAGPAQKRRWNHSGILTVLLWRRKILLPAGFLLGSRSLLRSW